MNINTEKVPEQLENMYLDENYMIELTEDQIIGVLRLLCE